MTSPALADNPNPMQTDGFEFVEYASLDPAPLEALFETLGFTHVGNHRSKAVKLYRQGDINFILNLDKTSHAAQFFAQHGPSANAMAFRVRDVGKAITHAQSLGAETVESRVGPSSRAIPESE